MIKLRWWLIRLLAGNHSIVMNVTIDGKGIKDGYAVFGNIPGSAVIVGCPIYEDYVTVIDCDTVHRINYFTGGKIK
jgi:hypothetical protein